MDLLIKFKSYLEGRKNPASKFTVKNYLVDVKKFVNWYETRFQKAFAAANITPQLIEEFKKDKAEGVSARSIDRYLSSLRLFFHFLKLEEVIRVDPFEEAQRTAETNKSAHDLYQLKNFKSYLYVFNASHLTIKNYIIDVKQFLKWAEEVTGVKDAWNVKDKNIFTKIDSDVVEEYKQRLIKSGFAPLSVNRKLSSLRRYLGWAAEEGLVKTAPMIQREKTDRILEDRSEKLDLEFLKSRNQGIPLQAQKILTSHVEDSYSKLPPLRLGQKLARGVNLLLDTAFISPLAKAVEQGQFLAWKLRGRPVFDSAELSKAPAMPSNIKKLSYAPLSIATRYLPFHRKIWHVVKHSRPNWYRQYHSYSVSHYFHLAILMVFMSALGFGFYQNFLVDPKSKGPAMAAAVSPLKILSFQGRLTDASDNPITATKWIRVVIYNDSSASGAARLWEEVNRVSPDTDGIFSMLLGDNGSGANAALCNSGDPPTSPPTGACGIPQSLFANNAALYLGVTVEADPELTPRQQLATVAYATNAETLQGLPPITDAGVTTNANAVLALNSSGQVSISGTATTTFQSTGGQLTITGKTLLLNSASGTDTNIQLVPDGLGKIDIQKPILNSTNNSNIATAQGGVEVDDIFAVLATSSAQSAFTVNQDDAGPLISASTSGTAKFTVDNSGNTTLAGDIAVNGATSADITSTTTTASLFDATVTTLNIGAAATTWDIGAGTGTGTVNNATLAITGLIDANGAGTHDIAGTLNLSGNTLTASTDLTLNPAGGQVVFASGDTFNIGGVTGLDYNAISDSGTTGHALASDNDLYVEGDVEIDGTLYLDGNLESPATGISGYWQRALGALAPRNITDDLLIGGTATSSAKFQVIGTGANAGNASMSGTLTVATIRPPTGALNLQYKSGADAWTNALTVLDNSGNVGIGATVPGVKLEVRKSGTGTSPDANATMGIVNAGIAYLNLYDSSQDVQVGLINNGGYGYIGTIGAQRFSLATDNAERLTVLPTSGNVGINDNSPDYLLELYDATNTPAFALSDDDVLHGVTTLAETDVFGHVSSISTTVGGLQVTGLADATGIALGLKGVQSSDPTDTTPAISLIGAKANGTGVQDLGVAETVLQIANNDNSAALTVLGDGSIGIGTSTPIRLLELTGSVATANSLNVISRPNEIANATYHATDNSGWNGYSGGAVSAQAADATNGFHTKFLRFTSDADADQGDRIFGNGGAHAEDFVDGKTYLISFMYRATNGFSIKDRDALITNISANTGKAKYYEIQYTKSGTATSDRFLVCTGATCNGANNNQVDIGEMTIQNLTDDAPASRFFASASTTGNSWFNAGNLGIGTTGPDKKLDILDTSGAQLRLTYTDGSVYSEIQTDTSGFMIFDSTGNRMEFRDYISLFAGASTTTVLGGYVDGDAAYRYAVDAAGKTSWGPGSGAVDTNLYRSAANWLKTDDSLNIVGDASTSGSLVFDGTNKSIDILNGSRLDFQTSVGGDDGLAAKMTILNSGNVGIGDTSPDYLLELNDTTNTPTFALSDDDVLHGVTTIANTDSFFHLSSISTTVGGAQLTGLASATGIALGLKGVQSSDPTDTTPAISLIGTKANGTGVQDLAATETILQIANNDDTTPALSVLGNGNVGIQIAAPTVDFEVSGIASASTNLTVGDAVKGASVRSIDVNGNWGGNAVISTQTLTSDNTVTVSTKGLAYHLSQNSGTTDATITVTFNITGLPDLDGTFAFIHTTAQKGITAGSRNTTVTIQVNGTQVSTVCAKLAGSICSAATGAGTEIEHYTLVRTNGTWHLSGAESDSNTADLAEWIPYEGTMPLAGELVTISSADTTVVRSNKAYDKNLAGIISTSPHTVMGKQTPDSVILGLSGQVPVIVSSQNGNIKNGDPITSSDLPGAGMKSIRPGTIVGKALEAFEPNDENCSVVNSYDEINWPNDDGTNPQKPCFKLPNGAYVGKIMALVGLGYNDPLEEYLADTGDLVIAKSDAKSTDYGSQTTAFSLIQTAVDGSLSTVDRVGAFAEIAVANLRAGGITAQEIVTDSLKITTDSVTVGSQNLREYIVNVIENYELASQDDVFRGYGGKIVSPIAEVDRVYTNVISPLAQDSNISVSLGNSKFEIRNSKDASGSAVATIDSSGNASFSGQISANQASISGNLNASEASIAGTLRAKNIIADSIEGLDERIASSSADPNYTLSASQLNAMDIASFSSQLAYVENLNTATLTVNHGLMVFGPTSLSDLSVVNQLSIGGNLILADNSINVLGSTLEIQPLKQGAISMMGGMVEIDIDGNFVAKGNVTVKGILAANIISPIPDADLVIRLGASQGNTSEVTGTGSSDGGGIGEQKFRIENSSGSAVLTINQLGDVIASGAGSFAKLNLSPVSSALAISDTEVIATGSAGVATISANMNELTVRNNLVTDKSLIYITPVGDTANQVLYLMRQLPQESFTIGTGQPTAKEIPFNWLIIN